MKILAVFSFIFFYFKFKQELKRFRLNIKQIYQQNVSSKECFLYFDSI